MAKHQNPPAQSPATVPGAVPPVSEPDPTVQPAAPGAVEPENEPEPQAAPEPDPSTQDPTLEVQPSQQSAEAKAAFRVNWLFVGFREDDLAEGDVVVATEAEAAPFLGGVLTRIEPEA